MLTPATMAIALMTVMLWILWSDTLRARRPTPILYAMRIALFLIVSGMMIVNLVRVPHHFNASSMAVTIVAAVVGVVGAVYFTRKLVRRQ